MHDPQYFFSGTPWEINTRDLAALTINMAFGTNLTAYDVVYANAMEGIGMLQILEAYNALESTQRTIPYAIVRGSSDW